MIEVKKRFYSVIIRTLRILIVKPVSNKNAAVKKESLYRIWRGRYLEKGKAIMIG